MRGGWFGLALGDALGATSAAEAVKSSSLAWTQPTALALCLAESLDALGRSDARDQIERYWRWFKDGHLSATDQPGEGHASPDVAKALATFRWRGLPVAGSHDPKDAAATSLPRVLAAALFAGNDPAAAIALAAECARTTHQSPLILDACRAYSAMLLCALGGRPAQDWLRAVPEPVPGGWTARPLRKDVQAEVATASVAGDTRRPVARSTCCRRSHWRGVSPATHKISRQPSPQRNAASTTMRHWSPGSSARCSACSTVSMRCPRMPSVGSRAASTSTSRSSIALRALRRRAESRREGSPAPLARTRVDAARR
ncbi:MAG: ADP-ribosylglycohydrolase family protein [Proteobacteria bacterium]|nr:ADP-ribosylglycohydrolase family protein [Pseudomonadota bacterium]